MRCFFAITLPESLKKELNDCLSQLKPFSHTARWVSTENLHLTLKFLGNVRDTQISELIAKLQPLLQSVEPFKLSVRGVGTFPAKGAPNVFWVGIEASDVLFKLHHIVDDVAASFGIPKEQRRFSPHLTIGRARGYETEKLMSRFRTFGNTFFGSIDVHEISLFQSILKPSGAEYRRIDSWKLGRRKDDLNTSY
jgi:2'-5' RNA ligase